ncbi:hypothetical protein M407DRAFT_86870, partial [Tulasnella calospora MUT 4182]
KREEYFVSIGKYQPGQLVFVDESAVDRCTPARRYGWARSGQQARMHGHFVHGARYVISTKCSRGNSADLHLFRHSLLPTLSLDGILYTQIVEGSFTGESFLNFVLNLLEHMQPFLA